MTNYTPISLLTVFFSKLLEKAVRSRLSQHLHANNIQVTEHNSFGKEISTEDAPIRLTDSVLTSINKNMHISGIFCDLAKVFDCMNDEVLLIILYFYGS
jgi:hypothetical protein